MAPEDAQIPDLDTLLDPDEELVQQVLGIRQRASDQSFRSKVQDARRLENRIRQVGLEPPGPPEKGMFFKVLDALDTAGQWTRGGLSSALGLLPEYSNLSLIEAAKKGAAEDLTVGEILDRKGLKNQYARAVAGFVGDVATDPLSWLLPLGGGAKIGGKVLSKGVQETLTAARPALQAARSGGKFAHLPDAEKAVIDSGITTEIADLVRSASGLSKTQKKVGRALNARPEFKGAAAEKGLLDENGQVLDFLKREAELKDRFRKLGVGLDPNTPISEIFQKPAIQLQSPFAGFPGFASIPLIGSSKAMDIPGVTKASEALYRMLDDRFYGVNLKVGDILRKGINKGKASEGKIYSPLANTAAWAAEMVGSIPKHLSRTILSGGKEVNERVREQAVHAGALRQRVKLEREALFKDLPDDLLEQATLLTHTGLTKSYTQAEKSAIVEGYKKANIGIPDGAGGFRPIGPNDIDDIFDQHIQNEALNNLAARFEAQQPGSGQKLRDIFERSVNDFKTLSDIEIEKGLGTVVRKHYLPMIYENLGDTKIGKDMIDQFAQKGGVGGSNPKFTLAKTFGTVSDAVKYGLVPNLNLADLWEKRKLAHELALAEAKFFDNMRFEFGLPKELKALANTALASERTRLADEAINFAANTGMRFDKKDEFGAFSGQIGALAAKLEGKPVITINGQPIRPGSLSVLEADSLVKFNEIEAMAKEKHWPYQVEVIGTNVDGTPLRKIVFDQQFKANVDQIGGLADQWRKNLPGRAGEVLGDRAGGKQLPEPILRMVEKNKKEFVDDDYFDYYRNLLPGPVVDSIDDAMDMRGTLAKVQGTLPDGPMKSSLTYFLKGYLPFLNMHKYASTMLYPTYHAQNFGSIFPLRMNALSSIGKAINPLELVDNHLIKSGKRTYRNASGELLSGRSLIEEMNRYNVETHFGSETDIIDALSNGIQTFNGNKKEAQDIAKKLASKRNPFTALSHTIEKLGREQTYISLRKEGYDPASAANEVARIFTDYSHGKTQFEKHFLNNFLFFYSFGRAQTANTLTALITRPGAITGQIAVKNAVAQALTDPNAEPLPKDIDEDMKSLRMFNSLSSFVGRDKSGRPEIMTNVGLPLEQVARYGDFVAPRNLASLKDWVEATGDNASKAMQTAIAQSNPIFKTLFETLVTQKSAYFDRPITDKMLRRIPKWESDIGKLVSVDYKAIPRGVFEGLDNATKAVLGATDNGDGTMTANPYALATLVFFVPGASRLIGSANVFADENNKTSRKWLRQGTGVKIQQMDVERSLAYDRVKNLKDYMESEGIPLTKTDFRIQQLLSDSEDEDVN